MLTYEEYIQLLKQRRRIVAFTDQEVSDEDIHKIVDAARYAPSAMNFQPWEFVVVRGKDKVAELTQINMGEIKLPKMLVRQLQKTSWGRRLPKGTMKQAHNASILIIAVGDTRKKITLPGQGYRFDGKKIKLKKPLPIVDVDSLFYSSMANAFLQMITAAASLGLGSKYVTLVSSPIWEKEVKKQLGIPDYMKIYDAAAIGYPAHTPRKKFIRELDGILHFDQYNISKSWSDAYIVEREKNRQDIKYL